MVLACKVKTRDYPSVSMVALLHGVECEPVDQDGDTTYFDLVGNKSMTVAEESVRRGSAVFVLDNSKVIPLPHRAVNA